MQFMNQRNERDEKIKLINDLLENDKNGINIDNLYFYEKEGEKILFQEKIKKKEKPTSEEVNNIFEILINCTSYIHKDFFKENYDIFKKPLFDMMDSLSSKEVRNYQKEVTELASNFFIKIKYLLSSNNNIPQMNMDEINLTLSLKMIKSQIFDKKIQGLKTIGKFIKNCSNEEDI